MFRINVGFTSLETWLKLNIAFLKMYLCAITAENNTQLITLITTTTMADYGTTNAAAQLSGLVCEMNINLIK